MSDLITARRIQRQGRLPESFGFHAFQPSTQTFCYFDDTNWRTAFVDAKKTHARVYVGIPEHHDVTEDGGWKLWKG